ncbi:uncharacterized protein EHS24_003189 [Apiotrichum porosum]|uniref:Uncharacterized protein n=1 Tax=Apiotrichum porosum TaxID=105984 RepID=A0A427XFG1_9TREE|nr:uncharacterized protein EHS24_003189 [Apiotrichum porosum]RSH77629.1 hypothetical protein EHS24_003189 [Apiotrichum porosum]
MPSLEELERPAHQAHAENTARRAILGLPPRRPHIDIEEMNDGNGIKDVVDDIKVHVKRIENDVKDAKEDTNGLCNDVDIIKDDMEDVKCDVKRVKHDLKGVKEDAIDLWNGQKEMLDILRHIDSQTASTNAQIARLTERNTQLTERNTQLTERNTQLVERNVQLVEYNARLVEDRCTRLEQRTMAIEQRVMPLDQNPAVLHRQHFGFDALDAVTRHDGTPGYHAPPRWSQGGYDRR